MGCGVLFPMVHMAMVAVLLSRGTTGQLGKRRSVPSAGAPPAYCLTSRLSRTPVLMGNDHVSSIDWSLFSVETAPTLTEHRSAEVHRAATRGARLSLGWQAAIRCR